MPKRSLALVLLVAAFAVGIQWARIVRVDNGIEAAVSPLMTSLQVLGRVLTSRIGILVFLAGGVATALACSRDRPLAVYAAPGLLWFWACACLPGTDFFGDPGRSFRYWIESLGVRVLTGAVIVLAAGPLGTAAGSLVGMRRGTLFGLVSLGPFGTGLALSGVQALRSMSDLATVRADPTQALHLIILRADRLLECGAIGSLLVCTVLAAILLRSSERGAARLGSERGPTAAGSAWSGPLSPTPLGWGRLVTAAWGVALVCIAMLVVAVGVELQRVGFFEEARMAPGWWRDPETWLDRDAIAAVLLVIASHVVRYFIAARRVTPRFASRFGDRMSYRDPSAPDLVLLNREAITVAEQNHAAVATGWSVALSLGVALVGVAHAVQPFHVRPNAEFFVYFALSLACLLSHGPWAAARTRSATRFATASGHAPYLSQK